MQKLISEGRVILKGEIEVSGSKNSGLAAAICIQMSFASVSSAFVMSTITPIFPPA